MVDESTSEDKALDQVEIEMKGRKANAVFITSLWVFGSVFWFAAGHPLVGGLYIGAGLAWGAIIWRSA